MSKSNFQNNFSVPSLGLKDVSCEVFAIREENFNNEEWVSMPLIGNLLALFRANIKDSKSKLPGSKSRSARRKIKVCQLKSLYLGYIDQLFVHYKKYRSFHLILGGYANRLNC